jgi:protein TonB
MTPHVDILDERERLSRYFFGSLVLHISIAATLLTAGKLSFGSKFQFGDPHGGGFGSVAITPTSTIPLPAKSGPTNPVANDTQSQVPTPPPNAKARAKNMQPDADAIPMLSKKELRRAQAKAAAEANKWRLQQKDLPNQLYATGGQQVSTPDYNKPGSGDVGVGNNSPFGTQYGWYATALRDKVARNWHTSDIAARGGSVAVVTCVIRRDGSLAPGSVKVSQPSGNPALDLSAQRAVLDAAPFGALPPGFPNNQASVELRFELRR